MANQKAWTATRKARQAANYTAARKRDEERAYVEHEKQLANNRTRAAGELTPWQQAQQRRAALRELRSHKPQPAKQKPPKLSPARLLEVKIEQLRIEGIKPEWAKPGWRHPDRPVRDNDNQRKAA